MLNPNCFESIVASFMSTLNQVEDDIKDDGYELVCKFSAWELKQAIINRATGTTMMAAAEDWLEACEKVHLS